MAIGQVYRLLILDQKFACRLDKNWPINLIVPVATAGKTQLSTSASSVQQQSQIEAGQQLSDEETMQLIMGMTYSLKNMLIRLSPAKGAADVASIVSSPNASRRPSSTPSTPTTPASLTFSSPQLNWTQPSEYCFSYLASKYRLTYYESVTGWKFILLSEPLFPAQGELEALMRRMYAEVFVKHVVQNPIYRMQNPEAGFQRPGLLAKLDEFIMNYR